MKRYQQFFAVFTVLCCFSVVLSTMSYAQLSRWGIVSGYSREETLKAAKAAHFSTEQINAINTLFDRYEKQNREIVDEVNRVLPNLPYTPDGKSGIRSIERIEFMNKKLEIINRAFETDYKRIADWKGGKNPDEKQKTQQEQPQQNQPQTQQLQKSSAAEKIANAEEAFPNNPHDKLDKIPGMNLSANQKTQINKLQKQRQEQMSKTVTNIKVQKIRKSKVSVRKIFGILKFIAYLFNYRIERHLTPQQIVVLRNYRRVPVEVDRLEDLLGGASPDEIFPSPNETGTKEWNNGQSAEETGERLTRTNWQSFDELKTLLNLNDDQLFALEGLDAEAKAANIDAVERISEQTNITDADIRNICNQHAERFTLVNDRIRSKMQRNQMEKFNVLQLLLLDVQEFPEANMASFRLFELSDNEKKNLNAAMIFFVLNRNNLKMLTDPNSVSVEQQKNAQKALEQKVKVQLPQTGIDTWTKIVADNKELLNTIRKYKER
ncbi:MAG: hypothetical protein LBC20_18455 [Planctomycetaceae bacterium]|jgi:hypothetical protein|nr:hypothetical protein [Planctomycetaceae bacterium]